MGAKFKIGDAVKEVVEPLPNGVVKSIAFNGNDIQYEVAFEADAEGNEHVLYVNEDKLETT